jgi:hypothetical protein
MPATIIEVLSVAEARLADPAFQDAVAEHIIKGLCRWYDVPYVPVGGEDMLLDCTWVRVPGTKANLATAKKIADGRKMFAEVLTPGTLSIHVRNDKLEGLVAHLQGYTVFKGKMKLEPTYAGSFRDVKTV